MASTLIPACELAAMRAVEEASLDTPATVNHVTVTRSAAGGQIPASTTLATCNVRLATPSAPILQQYADKIGNLQVWVVRLPSAVQPRPGDQIVIASGASAGTYTVQVPLPQSYSMLTGVLATKVV